jgi:hypothetical protein
MNGDVPEPRPLPEKHSVTLDAAAVRVALGLPTGSRITSLWVDCAGRVEVTYETPLETFRLERRSAR